MHKQNQEKERENLRKDEKNLKTGPWENGERIKGLWREQFAPKEGRGAGDGGCEVEEKKVCPSGCEVEEMSVLKG